MLIGKHNEAITVLGDKFETEAPEHVDQSLAPLLAAIGELKQLCAQHESALEGKAAEVQARVGEAAQRIERIAPALEAATQLG